MPLNCSVREDSWEFLGLQGDPASQSKRKSVLNIHLKDWCWRWSSSTLAILCEELTHWKRPWCWERLKAGEEGDDRGWDGWMASPTQWIWVWVGSGNWWWTRRPGMLQAMGLQRVRHDWAWTDWLNESGKGREAKRKEELPGNSSADLRQGSDSTLKYTGNNVFKLFYMSAFFLP